MNLGLADSNNSSRSILLAQKSSARVYQAVNLSILEAILGANILSRRESPTMLRFDSGGYKIFTSLQACKGSDGSECKGILLQTRFRLSNRPDLAVVNDWNRNKRGSRAYIADNDAVVLESDIDLYGGATEEYIKFKMEYFPIALESFANWTLDKFEAPKGIRV